jgi:hypothetical protein
VMPAKVRVRQIRGRSPTPSKYASSSAPLSKCTVANALVPLQPVLPLTRATLDPTRSTQCDEEPRPRSPTWVPRIKSVVTFKRIPRGLARRWARSSACARPHTGGAHSAYAIAHFEGLCRIGPREQRHARPNLPFENVASGRCVYVHEKGSSAASLVICDRKFESVTPTSRMPLGGGNTDRIRSRAS